MKTSFIRKAALFLILVLVGSCLAGSRLFAASPDPALLKAKAEAEAKGYLFFTTHDEVVAGARKEGKLRILTSLEGRSYKVMIDAFKKRYPFIDVFASDIKGPDTHQKFLLELKAGIPTEWDVFNMAPEFYPEYMPYIKRLDILGMATQKVLAIPTTMIDPKNRTVVVVSTTVYGIGYNRKRIPEDKLPRSYEDFLKPEFKGKKFLVDIRPTGFANLAVELGEEKVEDYARKIAAQDPVWVRGATRPLTSIAAGEHTLFLMTYYQSCLRSAEKAPTGSLGCKLIEPVPAMLRNFNAITNVARHPHSGLLWLRFLATPEGQKIIDDYEGLNSFIYAPGSGMAKATQGKKLSVNNWDTLHNTAKWEQMVFKAFGFPRAEETKR
ncbi:MAG: extracellular solute-binding protein [Deltaproteobacteria bacterium]|nr:extracellular solute-binding protein [Deltaproteobacteria bacterium]